MNAKASKWRTDNKEYKAYKDKEYRLNNLETIQATKKKYREKNKDKIAESYAQYYLNNKDKLLAYQANYNKANPKVVAALKDKWRLLNKDKVAASQARYNKANPHKANAIAARYRAAKILATPEWSDLKQISIVYEYASLCSKVLKQDFHVDHIVPLRGKTVSGLHVPANLQVLDALANISKSNRQWPDMWGEKV